MPLRAHCGSVLGGGAAAALGCAPFFAAAAADAFPAAFPAGLAFSLAMPVPLSHLLSTYAPRRVIRAGCERQEATAN